MSMPMHGHPLAHACTHAHTYRHINPQILICKYFHSTDPNYQEIKQKVKRLTVCYYFHWMKIFYNLHIWACIKHFVKFTMKLPEIPTTKEYILTFRISIKTNHLELQTENWKMHEKTERFVNTIVFLFWKC